MTKQDEFIANWQPEFGADQHIFKEHLATIIQSECEAFGEWLILKRASAMKGGWLVDNNSDVNPRKFKTTSELYNSKEFTDYKNRKV